MKGNMLKLVNDWYPIVFWAIVAVLFILLFGADPEPQPFNWS